MRSSNPIARMILTAKTSKRRVPRRVDVALQYHGRLTAVADLRTTRLSAAAAYLVAVIMVGVAIPPLIATS